MTLRIARGSAGRSIPAPLRRQAHIRRDVPRRLQAVACSPGFWERAGSARGHESVSPGGKPDRVAVSLPRLGRQPSGEPAHGVHPGERVSARLREHAHPAEGPQRAPPARRRRREVSPATEVSKASRRLSVEVARIGAGDGRRSGCGSDLKGWVLRSSVRVASLGVMRCRCRPDGRRRRAAVSTGRWHGERRGRPRRRGRRGRRQRSTA